jgi:hypothetical protein
MNRLSKADRERFPYTATVTVTMSLNVGTDERPEMTYYKAKRVFHSAFPIGKRERQLIKDDPKCSVYWSDELGTNFTFDRAIDDEKKLWVLDETFNNELTRSEAFLVKEEK